MVDLGKVNRDVTELMKRVYGDRLAAIVLFGSYARDDFHEESDVDYLVVLTDDEVSAMRETSQISPVMNDYYFETFIRVSAFAVAGKQLTESNRPIFQQVRKDGKTVYDRKLEVSFK